MIEFQESWIRVRSMRSFWSRRNGGGRYKITLSDEQLTLRPLFPASLSAGLWDIVEHIPRSCIEDVYSVQSWAGFNAAVHYRDQEDQQQVIELSLWDPVGFLAAWDRVSQDIAPPNSQT